LQQAGTLTMPAMGILGIFICVVILPVSLYLFYSHRDWTLLYLSADISGLYGPAMAVSLAASLIVGWALGAFWIRREKIRPIFAFILCASVVFLGSAAALYSRLGVSGSVEDFENGTVANLFDAKLGFELIPLLVGLLASVLVVANSLRRDSIRARSR